MEERLVKGDKGGPGSSLGESCNHLLGRLRFALRKNEIQAVVFLYRLSPYMSGTKPNGRMECVSYN